MGNKRIGQFTERTSTQEGDKIPFERSNVASYILREDFFNEIQTLIDDTIKLGGFKTPVRVASTANVSTSTAPSSIDGVTLASGDRILLKDQTTASQNGIYTFASAGSALTRAADMDSSSEVVSGMIVSVKEGTINADTFWTLSTNDTITIGSTSLTFEKISGNIQSDTLSNWNTRKSASTLPDNQWIYISDKSIYLFCTAVNKFSSNGFYTSGGYLSDCVWNTYTSVIRFVRDQFGNEVNVSASGSVTKWKYNALLTTAGDQNVSDNKISGDADISDADGSIIGNEVHEGCEFTVTGDGTVNRNLVTGASTLDCTDIVGTFKDNYVGLRTTIYAPLDSGITVEGCRFEYDGEISLDQAVSYSGKTVEPGFSDFNKSYSITGLTTLTFNTDYDKIIGIANLTSGNAIETINLFANAPQKHPFRIYPESDLAVKFTHNTGANQPILKNGVDAIINGAKKEWIEFTYNSTISRYEETNRGCYSQTNDTGLFAVPGDSAPLPLTKRVTTTSATPDSVTFALPADSTWAYEVKVCAVQQSGAAGTIGDSFGYFEQGIVKNLAGTTSLPGSQNQNTFSDAASSTWTVTVTGDNSTDSLKVEVTGQANKTIRWTVYVLLIQTGFRDFA